MKKVLFNSDIRDADCACYIPTDKSKLSNHVLKYNGINVGNKVFNTAVLQYLTKPDIDLDLLPIGSMSPEEASEKYDYVVAAYANIFHPYTDEYFVNKTKWIQKLKIPFYVIGCGIQCNSMDQLKTMKKNIGNSVAEFVDAIEKSGGSIATRGYVTKEFLDDCCNNKAVATGCPSFYRHGREFVLEKKKARREDFRVAFTSYDYPKKWIKEQLAKYPKSGFVDQQYIFSEYFSHENIELYLNSLYEKYGKDIIEYYLSGKIYSPIDIPCWEEHLNQYTYSFGSRLHGCSMSLFAHTPAKLVCIDLRCKEVADYFGIPTIGEYNTDIDLYDDYMALDLDPFNKKYQHGLSGRIG